MIKSISSIVFLASICIPAPGQDPRVPDQTAPPPLKLITRQERSQLNEAKDAKARIKLGLELAEAHLANAENQTTLHDYDKAAAEAGMYWALVEDSFAFMKTIERDNDRRRDLYKRLELALRAHAPRLNSIRRGTPSEYAVWIKEIEDFARNGRTEALNSFYGNTVLRDAPRQPSDNKQSKKPPRQNQLIPEK